MDFEMDGQKLRNYFFIISIVGVLFFLAYVTPVVFNFEESLNVGYFNTHKDYRTTYSDGYGELNMDITLNRERDDRYDYRISCYFTSGSSVEVVGLKYLNYTVNLAGSLLTAQTLDLDPPIEQFSRSSSARLNQDQTMVWIGQAEVQYISNTIMQNETIEFILRVQMSWSAEDYYNIQLAAYVVLFLWIMAFPLGPILLKAIFQPNFRGPLDEETRRKHKKYLDYFRRTEDNQD